LRTSATADRTATIATAIAAAHQDAQMLAAFVHQLVNFRNALSLWGSAWRLWRLVTTIISVVSTAAPWATVISCHLNLPILLRPNLGLSYVMCAFMPYNQARRTGSFIVTSSSEIVG
jgi:hypothetical protein